MRERVRIARGKGVDADDAMDIGDVDEDRTQGSSDESRSRDGCSIISMERSGSDAIDTSAASTGVSFSNSMTGSFSTSQRPYATGGGDAHDDAFDDSVGLAPGVDGNGVFVSGDAFAGVDMDLVVEGGTGTKMYTPAQKKAIVEYAVQYGERAAAKKFGVHRKNIYR